MPITPNNYIIKYFEESIQNNKKDGYLHPSYLMEVKLLNAIQDAQFKEASIILDNINKNKRPRLSHAKLRSLKNSLIGSCTLFTRAVIQAGVHAEKAFTMSDLYILKIDTTEDFEALNTLEYDMLKDFINLIFNEKKEPANKIVNKAINYINDQLLEELNLQIISENCYVNSSYLSHLFKKELGISLMKYINKKRVEESKKMLMHTKSSISEIATLLQFCNQSYYSAQFKKYEGLTPTEYREQSELQTNQQIDDWT